MFIVYTTLPDQATGKTIATALLEQKLIACANILGPSVSLYNWENEAKCEEEYILICKTAEACLEALQKAIEALHPYDCPAILPIPIAQANVEFAKWVETSVKLPY